jgi:hypothetical protein
MAGLGKEIDSTDPYWQKFIEDMRIANGAVPDFSGLKDDLIAVSSILGKLDFGSTISDEDYNKLIKYKDEWKDLFII